MKCILNKGYIPTVIPRLWNDHGKIWLPTTATFGKTPSATKHTKSEGDYDPNYTCRREIEYVFNEDLKNSNPLDITLREKLSAQLTDFDRNLNNSKYSNQLENVNHNQIQPIPKITKSDEVIKHVDKKVDKQEQSNIVAGEIQTFKNYFYKEVNTINSNNELAKVKQVKIQENSVSKEMDQTAKISKSNIHFYKVLCSPLDYDIPTERTTYYRKTINEKNKWNQEMKEIERILKMSKSGTHPNRKLNTRPHLVKIKAWNMRMTKSVDNNVCIKCIQTPEVLEVQAKTSLPKTHSEIEAMGVHVEKNCQSTKADKIITNAYGEEGQILLTQEAKQLFEMAKADSYCNKQIMCNAVEVEVRENSVHEIDIDSNEINTTPAKDFSRVVVLYKLNEQEDSGQPYNTGTDPMSPKLQLPIERQKNKKQYLTRNPNHKHLSTIFPCIKYNPLLSS